MTKLLICPIGLHGVKIKPKEIWQKFVNSFGLILTPWSPIGQMSSFVTWCRCNYGHLRSQSMLPFRHIIPFLTGLVYSFSVLGAICGSRWSHETSTCGYTKALIRGCHNILIHLYNLAKSAPDPWLDRLNSKALSCKQTERKNWTWSNSVKRELIEVAL